MIRRLKDTVLSKGVKVALNSKIREYGKVLKLNVDSKNKSMMIEVMLKGEKEPLRLEVERYELSEERERHLLKIYGVQTSRTWISTLAADYLEGKAFEIPAEYAKMLKMVV